MHTLKKDWFKFKFQDVLLFRIFLELSYLLISGEPVILVPERDAAVLPADCQAVRDWVPFHLHNGVLASRNLEIGHDCAVLAHKNDSGLVRCHRQDHVGLTAGPLRTQTLLVLSGYVVVKIHRHVAGVLLQKVCYANRNLFE